jgi:hypothetical protein
VRGAGLSESREAGAAVMPDWYTDVLIFLLLVVFPIAAAVGVATAEHGWPW